MKFTLWPGQQEDALSTRAFVAGFWAAVGVATAAAIAALLLIGVWIVLQHWR